MKNKLQELFALPFRTYPVADIDGLKLYTSDGLKRKYGECLETTTRTKAVGDKIKELVDKEMIIPVWLNKGIISLSVFKIFAPQGLSNIAGFYTSQTNQIFLLIDNNVTLGYAPNSLLAKLTIHESMHMSANHGKDKFVKLFTPEFVNFYSAFFRHLFEINKKTDIARESEIFFKVLFKLFEFQTDMTLGYFTKVISEYKKIVSDLFKTKTTLSEVKFQKNVDDLAFFLYLYMRDIGQFISTMRKYQQIVSSLDFAYREGLNIRNTTSICVQELIFPSEIICIYSEYCSTGDMSKIYQAFNFIK